MNPFRSFPVVHLGVVVLVIFIFLGKLALAPKTRRLGRAFLAATFAGLVIGPAMAYIVRDNPRSLEPLPAFPAWIVEIILRDPLPHAAYLAGAFLGAILVDCLIALLVLLVTSVEATRGR